MTNYRLLDFETEFFLIFLFISNIYIYLRPCKTETSQADEIFWNYY